MFFLDVRACMCSPCDQQRDREREGVGMEEVLVVNQMTWPELARQCIVANVRLAGVARPPAPGAGAAALLLSSCWAFRSRHRPHDGDQPRV